MLHLFGVQTYATQTTETSNIHRTRLWGLPLAVIRFQCRPPTRIMSSISIVMHTHDYYHNNIYVWYFNIEIIIIYIHTGHTILVVILHVSMISCIYMRLPIHSIYRVELGGDSNKNKCFIHYSYKGPAWGNYWF